MTETITSPQNEKLKLVRRLAERSGREREGLFVTEGEDLLAAGLAAGRAPQFVLGPVGSGPVGPNVEITPVEPELLAGVSALGSGTRALAVWAIPAPAAPTSRTGVCVFLDGVGDPGNVGAIVRTAGAIGGGEVVLGAGCADPYGPKAVRASMGAVFACAPRSAAVGATPEPRLALDAHGGRTLEQALLEFCPATICLGAERHGLVNETLAACQARATIPVRAGAESLNVAAAAAIALYRIDSAVQSPGSEGVGGLGADA